MVRKIRPVIQRFLEKVSLEENGCWRWLGSKRGGTGYGCFSIMRVQLLAHRFSYQFYYGDIPDDLVIDHICRNRDCVNPIHLRAVTMRENILCGTGGSATNAAKTHCKRGHELTDGNIYHHNHKDGGNKRICKQCKREALRRSHDKNRVKRNLARVLRKRQLSQKLAAAS